ncbi:hypothetical protein GE21DRAFT_1270425 [Neurospora crassa]|nr:hypothetical protein GE21DRAFT_1270425 [Neurospora crassa]
MNGAFPALLQVCRYPRVNRLLRNGCRWDVDARTRNWRDAAGGIHGRGPTRTEQLFREMVVGRGGVQWLPIDAERLLSELLMNFALQKGNAVQWTSSGSWIAWIEAHTESPQPFLLLVLSVPRPELTKYGPSTKRKIECWTEQGPAAG